MAIQSNIILLFAVICIFGFRFSFNRYSLPIEWPHTVTQDFSLAFKIIIWNFSQAYKEWSLFMLTLVESLRIPYPSVSVRLFLEGSQTKLRRNHFVIMFGREFPTEFAKEQLIVLEVFIFNLFGLIFTEIYKIISPSDEIWGRVFFICCLAFGLLSLACTKEDLKRTAVNQQNWLFKYKLQ